MAVGNVRCCDPIRVGAIVAAANPIATEANDPTPLAETAILQSNCVSFVWRLGHLSGPFLMTAPMRIFSMPVRHRVRSPAAIPNGMGANLSICRQQSATVAAR